MLKCGIYEHDITPKLGSNIPGYFNARYATGIKERLFAEAVCFAQDDKIVSVIVACDMISLPDEYCERARAGIAEKLDLPIAGVTIHCTHVHTGGPTHGLTTPTDYDFCAWVADKAVEAAVIASQRMREVKIGFGHDYDEKLANYRIRVLPDGTLNTNNFSEGTKPYGEIDPEVSCLIINNADGSRYGVIVNYACHTDCVSGTEFSSDFPGAMRETLKLVYGADFMPVFLNGFFGNLNHCDFTGLKHRVIPQYYRTMGRKLAGRVISAMEDRDVVWFEDPTIKSVEKRFIAKHRRATEEELDWAKDALERDKVKPLGAQDKYFADEIMEIEALGDRTHEVVVQVQKIGGVNLFACPYEMFVEFEHMLKKGSDSEYNICAANSNGDCGYVPTKELIMLSVYESRINKVKLEENAGYKIVDNLLEIMKTI